MEAVCGGGGFRRVRSHGEVLIIEMTFQGVLGVEVPVPSSSWVAFAEVWLLAGRPLPGIFALGTRYEF
jgi:hypothetical protein